MFPHLTGSHINLWHNGTLKMDAPVSIRTFRNIYQTTRSQILQINNSKSVHVLTVQINNILRLIQVEQKWCSAISRHKISIQSLREGAILSLIEDTAYRDYEPRVLKCTSHPSALYWPWNMVYLRDILNKYVEGYTKHRKAVCVYTNGLCTSCTLNLQYKRQQFRWPSTLQLTYLQATTWTPRSWS